MPPTPSQPITPKAMVPPQSPQKVAEPPRHQGKLPDVKAHENASDTNRAANKEFAKTSGSIGEISNSFKSFGKGLSFGAIAKTLTDTFKLQKGFFEKFNVVGDGYKVVMMAQKHFLESIDLQLKSTNLLLDKMVSYLLDMASDISLLGKESDVGTGVRGTEGSSPDWLKQLKSMFGKQKEQEQPKSWLQLIKDWALPLLASLGGFLWGFITSKFEGVWSELLHIFSKDGIFGKMLVKIEEWIEPITSFFKEKIFSPAMEKIENFFIGIDKLFSENKYVGKAYNKTKDFFEGIAGAFKEDGLVTKFIGKIGTFFSKEGMLGKMGKMLSELPGMSSITKAFSFGSKLGHIAGIIAGPLTAVFEKFGDIKKDIMKGDWGKMVQDIFSTIVAGIVTAVSGGGRLLDPRAILDVFDNFFAGMKDVVDKFVDEGIGAGITKLLKVLWDAFVDIAKIIPRSISVIITTIRDLIGWVTSKLFGDDSIITTSINSFFNMFIGLFDNITATISKVKDLPAMLWDVVSTYWGLMIDWFKDIPRMIKEKVMDLVMSINDFVADLIRWIGEHTSWVGGNKLVKVADAMKVNNDELRNSFKQIRKEDMIADGQAARQKNIEEAAEKAKANKKQTGSPTVISAPTTTVSAPVTNNYNAAFSAQSSDSADFLTGRVQGQSAVH